MKKKEDQSFAFIILGIAYLLTFALAQQIIIQLYEKRFDDILGEAKSLRSLFVALWYSIVR